MPALFLSQDSLDELEMNDYWKEVENIASSEVGAARGDSEADGEAQNEEQQKVPEGRTRRGPGSSSSFPDLLVLS